MSLDRDLTSRLAALSAAGLGRTLPRIEQRHGARYRVNDKPAIGFCSNDYLGYATETHNVASAMGASGSRLITGDLSCTRELETSVADWLSYPDAVVFPSGFQLNVGVLPALIEGPDTAYSDMLNHGSLIDGLRLSSGTVHRIPHRHAPQIPDHSRRHHWWVCESIYSMDGDMTDPRDVRSFLEQGHHVYIDEAHATGLYSSGRGWLAEHNVQPTVLVGTFGKAFGAAGAFVAGSQPLCHWIRTRARSFVYSTGPLPALIGTIAHTLPRVVGDCGNARRERLWGNVARFSSNLGILRHHPSPIFPFVIGPNERVVSLASRLLDSGFHVQAIRPPTVPEGTSRLRATLSALHTHEDIDRLSETLLALFAEHDLHPRTCLPS